jgi:hypothetical protein
VDAAPPPSRHIRRARPGAAIAIPLDWSELNLAVGPAYFTVTNVHPNWPRWMQINGRISGMPLYRWQAGKG